MKAVLCHSFGPPENLSAADIPSPPLEDGQVRIAVRACGVNFPDALMIQGLYQFKPAFPFSPGLEVAGDIIEVAADVNELAVGARVMATMMFGGFAEEVVVPAATVLPMPDGMSYEQGAGFCLAYGTSHIALTHRARLQANETLLVLGAAAAYALFQIQTRQLASQDDYRTTAIYTIVVALVATTIAGPFFWTWPASLEHWGAFIGLGICGGFGHYWGFCYERRGDRCCYPALHDHDS